ncbi:MAG: DUF2510 domain-containing protein [Acidimicrobiia bacterium]
MHPTSGWYPDPTDSTRERWWDGHAWTNTVRRAEPRRSGPARGSTWARGAFTALNALLALTAAFGAVALGLAIWTSRMPPFKLFPNK